MSRRLITPALCIALATVTMAAAAPPTDAGTGPERIVVQSKNIPLASLRDAAERALAMAPPMRDVAFEVPNFGRDRRGVEGGLLGPDPLLQDHFGPETTNILSTFDGSDNDDNQAVVGFRVAPPDTDGDVGPDRYLQMINLVTTIFDKNGVELNGPFPSNAFWSGFGGVCESTNRGDPVALYDETNDRWLVSQFAFNTDIFGNPTTPFVQCVAVSQTGDPAGAYNRYGYDLSSFGFNDYPKHGITSESITLMANLFDPPFFFFGGTLIAAMDKSAMYAGQTGTLVGFDLGAGEFGFVAADLDDPTGTAGFVPALFATAMSRTNLLDIWRIDVDWSNPAGASRSRIAALAISLFDNDLCTATREACVPQPFPGPALEAISDRLMHRLQIRDFGSHRSMVAAHTVDVGSGRAGIRWYEMREQGGTWSLFQEGTYGPGDGLHRWMPSIAINAGGDIGLGFLVSSSSTFLSSAVTGQSAGASGSGVLDAEETFCQVGTGVQTGTARAGDYSATTVDPVSDTFWHTNEYVSGGGDFVWNTRVCEFAVVGTGPTCGDGTCDADEDPCTCAADCGAPPSDEIGLCTDGVDNDCDSVADCADSDCSTDPACTSACNNNGICEAGEDCGSCPSDCVSGTTAGAVCGNGLCETADGENCQNCAADCNGKTNGRPSERFCCGFGDGLSPDGCGDSRCVSGGFSCTEIEQPSTGYCCGDLVCTGDETCDNCALDCTLGAEQCANGIDDDCNGFADCADGTCSDDPACSGPVMHVGDLDGSSSSAPRNRWTATVTIQVHDAGDAAVPGATVSGSWSAGASGSSSCLTDGGGRCSVSKGNIKGNVGSVIFSVTDVTQTGGSYDSGANHDPDGDSDGTSITVSRP